MDNSRNQLTPLQMSAAINAYKLAGMQHGVNALPNNFACLLEAPLQED